MASPAASPDRFKAAATTLLTDRIMRLVIHVGGFLVIAAVLGIFVFIFSETLPLFSQAKVTELQQVQLPDNDYRLLGVDQWTELPVVIDDVGQPHFVDLQSNAQISTPSLPFLDNDTPTAIAYNQRRQEIVYGLSHGRFCVVAINYQPDFSNNERRITTQLAAGPVLEIGSQNRPVTDIAYGGSEAEQIVAVIQQTDTDYEVNVGLLRRKVSLFGGDKLRVVSTEKLTEHLDETPRTVLVSNQGDKALVIGTNSVAYFRRDGDEMTFVQRFQPFGDVTSSIDTVEMVFGDNSVVATDTDGRCRVYSLYVPAGSDTRLYGLTKTFPNVAGNVSAYANSLRNKAFLISSNESISLRYTTTAAIRWQATLPYAVQDSVIASKFNRFLLLDERNMLHVWELDDPHPEAGFASYFQEIWYEGYPHPKYEWQSTGGADDFEVKLSMIPLLVGTLKGTLYAMLFAVPIALLSALYTSQFLDPSWRRVVKPTMEIMASLPSVVLGFLAALWLAPIIADRMPSVFMILLLIPIFALTAGWIAATLRQRHQVGIKPGWEMLALIPILAAACWIGWSVGPVIERTLFVVQDPHTGSHIADFRLWWPLATGGRFEQRNAMVVGFMMGFAVIPVIFTLAEDSMGSVPRALTSASLALGASRWQTAIRVVLPTASPAVFSAIMIGLGRAVGETMIVLMATGNTPVTDWDIFTGMRTLSANIAVELPEAPHGGTLYRSLFLGAFLLFMMTFALNTVAELLRQHLRKKYRTV